MVVEIVDPAVSLSTRPATAFPRQMHLAKVEPKRPAIDFERDAVRRGSLPCILLRLECVEELAHGKTDTGYVWQLLASVWQLMGMPDESGIGASGSLCELEEAPPDEEHNWAGDSDAGGDEADDSDSW